MVMSARLGTFCACALLLGCVAYPNDGDVGIFERGSDVGEVGAPGEASFDADSGEYLLGGSGGNMWFDRDEFFFVWKRVSGDVSLAADIEVLASGPDANAHRKGIIMIRQSLEGDAAYADVALHGDALTSLQFRDEKGGITREIRTIDAGPKRMRLEKRGDTFYMSIGSDENSMRPSGSSVSIAMEEPFYIGIGVCAHDNDKFEQARFSRVVLGKPSHAAGAIRTAVEIVPVASGDRTCALASVDLLESPTWSEDGKSLLLRGGDRAYRVPIEPGTRLVPDDEAMGRGKVGESASPDGTTVYFHSDESGLWQIYRRDARGGETMRLTAEDANCAFPHISPDGASLAYLSYDKSTVGFPSDESVDLRILDLETGEARTLASFYGGRGSFDAPAWSPDGTRLAFARYQPRSD